MGSLTGKAAIVGIGELKPTRDAGDRIAVELMADAAALAIADAGLEFRDIDGFLTGLPFSDPAVIFPSSVADYFGLRPRMYNTVDIGGAAPAGMVWRAAAAIDAGLCKAVLCVVGDINRFPDTGLPTFWANREFEAPYGNLGAPCGYALIAQRHMYEFGTKPEQMAKIAVDQRYNALKNPLAMFNDRAITIADVLQSKMVSDPLHLFETVSPCCGAGAMIVAAPEIARRSPHPPVWLRGYGEHTDHSAISYAPSLTTSPIQLSSQVAFDNAGVSHSDIDLVEMYDCFTITVLLNIEDAGFCKKGHGGPFVMEHNLTYEGDFPCNTHGGQLSVGQAGLAGGMGQVLEAARQLMGRGEERQVPGAKLAYVNGNGGIMADQATIILERRS